MNLQSEAIEFGDEKSSFDETCEAVIGYALYDSLRFPTSCPVCHVCINDGYEYSDADALHEHVSAMAQVRGIQDEKTQHCHRRLSELMRMKSGRIESTGGMDSAVNTFAACSTVSTQMTENNYSVEKTTKDADRRRLALAQIENSWIEKEAKISQSIGEHVKLRQEFHSIQRRRDLFLAFAENEISRIELHVLRSLNVITQTIEACCRQIRCLDYLRRQRLRLRRQYRYSHHGRLRRRCQLLGSLNKRRRELNILLRLNRQGQEEKEELLDDVKAYGEELRLRSEILRQQHHQVVQSNEFQYQFAVNMLQRLRAKRQRDFPSHCVQCQRAFVSVKNEQLETCERSIFDHCTCTDHCSDCVVQLQQCPNHIPSINTADLPYSDA